MEKFKIGDRVRFTSRNENVPYGEEGTIRNVKTNDVPDIEVDFPSHSRPWGVCSSQLELVLEEGSLECLVQDASRGAEAMRALQGRTDVECRHVEPDSYWGDYGVPDEERNFDSSNLEYRIKPGEFTAFTIGKDALSVSLYEGEVSFGKHFRISASKLRSWFSDLCREDSTCNEVKDSKHNFMACRSGISIFPCISITWAEADRILAALIKAKV